MAPPTKPTRANRPRPRSLPKVTPRQRAFARYYSDPESPGFRNATVAAQLANYSGKPGSNQLAVQGHRLLHNPNVWEMILEECEKSGATLAAAAQCVARALHATEVREVLNEKGESVFARVPIYKVQLKGVELYFRIVDASNRASGNELRRGQITVSADPGLTGGDANKNPYAQLCATDRLFVRSFTEKVVAASNLEALSREHRPKSNGS